MGLGLDRRGGVPLRWCQLVLAAWIAAVGIPALAAEPREMGLLPEPAGDLLGFENRGDVPDLPADGELVVEKLKPSDCRVVLGFVHSPVDGRVDSWGYNGVVQEYDDSQGYRGGHWQNVTYELLEDPAVHVTLGDDGGFNYLVLRGGFTGTIYQDVDALDGPGAGKVVRQVEEFTGPQGPDHYLVSRHAFEQPVTARRLSFFRRDHLLADVAFYRIGDAAVPSEYTGSLDYRIGAVIDDTARLGPDFVRLPASADDERHPDNFQRRFFRPSDRTVRGLAADAGLAGEPARLGPSQQLHLITPPLGLNTPVGAVRVDLHVDGVPEGNLVSLAVQDPLIGNQELLRIDVRMGSSNRVRCLLDFPDQVIEAGGRTWLTVASQHGGTLAGDSTVSLLTAPEATARQQHLAWRLFLLKGYFYVLSESRPWTGRRMSVEWLTGYDGREWNIQRVRPQLMDLFRTVEHLKRIAPQHPIAVGQYHAWLTRRDRPALEPEHVPNLPRIPGVPRWAQLLDRAAQSIVYVPNWWVAHRMAPNGEMGGFLGDDTDMLQWWIPCALLDAETFLPAAKDAFQRMNRLVLETNLRDGVNLKTTDALHAYEEGTNHTCLMPLLFYGNPEYLEQLMLAARTTERWMYRTERGTLAFRTNELGWETAMHPPDEVAEKASSNAALLLHPHLILAWYNEDPRALETITGYLDHHGQRVPDAYGGGLTLSFGAYWITGDPKWLRLPGPDSRGMAANDRPWARFHPELVVHGHEARQQPWWPDYQRKHSQAAATGDWAWATGQDRDMLQEALEHVLWGNPHSRGGGVERYRYLWTEAEQFTDRVFLPVEVVAQAMLGGYNVRNRLWPAYAVSYERLGGDFAALVLEQGRDRLRVAMINLRDDTREGAFRVWQLDHGRYELTIGPDADDDGEPDSIAESRTLTLRRMDRVPVALPPRQLMIYDLRQVSRLDDVYQRADLAVCRADVESAGDDLRITVHNLGRSPARDFTVAVSDAWGRRLAETSVDELAAPKDLVPSRLTVTLPRPAGAERVLVDADQTVAELTEANNSADVCGPP